VALTRLDGSATSFGALRTRWALVYFGSSDCQAACERALYHMRQVIAAQGREAHRLQSVMIVTDAAALTRLREQLKDFPQTHALTGARTAIERLAQEFALPAGGALAGLHRIYVVDPLGNLMMSYTADVDPNGMRKDLARLLRYSQIG
jgi:cytochrome oxidase Cu insertion factor (SCO1/SenC/PrrC family)